jgi:uncharacterized membrane protein
MTTYHPTSCTECEELKLGDCATCDMHKWRVIQNALAWLIAMEMIAALTCAVYYALLVGTATDSFMKYGNAYFAADVGSVVTFISLVMLFLMRERVSAWVLLWADFFQSQHMIKEDEEEDDE